MAAASMISLCAVLHTIGISSALREGSEESEAGTILMSVSPAHLQYVSESIGATTNATSSIANIQGVHERTKRAVGHWYESDFGCGSSKSLYFKDASKRFWRLSTHWDYNGHRGYSVELNKITDWNKKGNHWNLAEVAEWQVVNTRLSRRAAGGFEIAPPSQPTLEDQGLVLSKPGCDASKYICQYETTEEGKQTEPSPTVEIYKLYRTPQSIYPPGVHPPTVDFTTSSLQEMGVWPVVGGQYVASSVPSFTLTATDDGAILSGGAAGITFKCRETPSGPVTARVANKIGLS
jgi:hypothetical protein